MATTSSTSASSVSQGGSLAAVPQPTEAQQRVLERIAAQRDRLHARRTARMQAMALARHEQGLGGTDESLALRAAAFARAPAWAPAFPPKKSPRSTPNTPRCWRATFPPIRCRSRIAAGRCGDGSQAVSAPDHRLARRRNAAFLAMDEVAAERETRGAILHRDGETAHQRRVVRSRRRAGAPGKGRRIRCRGRGARP